MRKAKYGVKLVRELIVDDGNVEPVRTKAYGSCRIRYHNIATGGE